jgi:hypothetical protein
VKVRYHLWVTAAEKAAIARVLAGCPGQKLPTARAIPLGGNTAIAPTSSPTATSTSGSTSLDPKFDTCTAATAAGYGPYYAGKDSEYSWYQDRDHDGIVCE